MSDKSAKGLLDLGQHGWLLPNPCRGDLGADKQAPCAVSMWEIGPIPFLDISRSMRDTASEMTEPGRL